MAYSVVVETGTISQSRAVRQLSAAARVGSKAEGSSRAVVGRRVERREAVVEFESGRMKEDDDDDV